MDESSINLYALTSKVLCFEALLLCGILLLSTFIFIYAVFPATLIKLYQRLDVYRCGARIRTLVIDGVLITFAERGYASEANTSMLMIHGFSTTKSAWLPVVRRLPKGAHCVSIDLPGHGDTPAIDDVTVEAQADKIHTLVEALGLRDFHLLGISMGGLLAGVYTSRHPDDVKLLTLVCPAMKTPELTKFQEEVRDGKCSLIAETVAELRNMLSLIAHHPIKAPTQILKGFLQLRKPRHTYFRKLIKELGNEEAGEILETLAPSLHQPTQLIWGEYDQLIHVSGADFLKQKLRNCRRVDIIQQCGHSVMIDRPGNVTKVIRLFRQENNVLP